MAKSIEQRWSMTPEVRRRVIGELLKIVVSPESSAREKTAAAKALMAAEKQNQVDEHKLIDVQIHRRLNDLDAIAADLGIEISVIEDATGPRESGINRIESDGREGSEGSSQRTR